MSEPSGSGSETGDEPERQEPPGSASPLSRLDPDRAVGGTPPESSAARPEPIVVDTRRYRWMIGIFGLVLVIAVSIYQFANHGVGTTGVPPGQRLHLFAAPLANTDLNGDPNLAPPCSQARHDPRALNICLLARHGPLVLAFFVIGSSDCEHEVDALQTLSRQFPASEVHFAAVAIEASHGSVAALVRSRRWTIPVAYDRDGSVGGLYEVEDCPMAELAYRGGIVRDRLIGNQWQTVAELGPRVRALVRAQRARDAS